MKMITKRGIFLWFIVLAFVVGLGFMTFSLVSDGDVWVMKTFNTHVYTNGKLVGAGTIYDKNNKTLVATKKGNRSYAKDETVREATLHIIGDPSGFISTGIQTKYRSVLTGYSLLYGVYNIEKYGKGNNLKLTVDSDVCKIAYNALDGRKGTVAVFNYKTGDIVCSVSSPSYDIENVPEDINTNSDYEGAYINRFMTGLYTPGSTWKLVTSISAIENIPDIYSQTWYCDKEYKPESGGDIICMGTHGTIDFKEALAESCNVAFAKIAISLGKDNLTKTVKELGMTESFSIDGVTTSKGNFGVKKADEADLGWAGVGQYTTMITPASMLRLVGAIANGGVAVPMHYIDKFTDQTGKTINVKLDEKETQLLDSSTADKMKKLMRNNVKSQYGDYNFDGLSLCAKSGTAQVDDVSEHNTAWFVGFMNDDKNPYAFVVVVEHGGFGTSTGGTIANKVLQKIVNK